MLELWIGRTGSGKSAAALEQIASRPDRPAYLIVPEQASHETERRLCEAAGDRASLYAEVLSFTRLAARVFAQAGGGAAPEMDAGGRILLMHRAVQSVAGQLTVYASPSQKTAFLEQLLATSDELKGCCIAPDVLAQAAQTAGREGEKLGDIALICGAYDAIAAQTGVDPKDRLTRLADALDRCSWGTGADFYLDGFVDFTPQERQVIRRLLKRCDSMTVCLTCDRLEGEDPSGVFSAAQRTGRQLRRLSEEIGTQCKVKKLFREERTEQPLWHLEQALFAQPAPPPVESDGHVALFEGYDVRGEAEWAASEILRLVREKGWRFRDISVAARSFDTCGDVVESVFRRYGIPLFRAVRTPVLQKPVFALVTSALEAASNGYQYDDVFRYLKTGLTPFSQEMCDWLENYVLKWNIRGNRWTQQKPWNWHPEGYGLPWTDHHKELVEQLDQLRRAVVAPLENLRKNTRKTGAGQAISLYKFLEEIELPQRLTQRAEAWMAEGDLNRAEEYRQLWEIFAHAIEQCAQLLGDAPMELDEFTALLKLVLSQYEVGSIPVSLDRVTAGDLNRVTGHGRKALFLLGADSGAIPQVSTAAGLLSDEDRTLLASFGLESSNRLDDRLEREMNILYLACTCPTDYLAVSWSAHGGDGGEKQPCFLVERLQQLFSDVSVLEEETQRESMMLAAPLPALELAAQREEVRRTLAGIPEYRSAAERIAAAKNWTRGNLTRPVVDKLYGREVPMSASRMDKYKQCHFSFFMQYGLKAKARRPAGFEAPEYGTFVHAVLESVFRTAKERGGVKTLTDAEITQLTNEAVETYIQTSLGGLQEETPRFRYLFRRLTGTVRTVVRNMAEELRRSDFQPISFELGFGADGALPPVELTQNGVTICISGFVDRIDGWVQGDKLYIRVVDYKTGRKSFDLTEIWNGLGLQMLLYLFTLGREGKELYRKTVVPAGVLYLPAREVIVSGSRSMSEEEQQKKVDAELKRRGLVLEDEAVLNAMEHLEGGQPRFLPVRVSSRTGEISGESLVSAQRFGRLERHIRMILKEICQELASGNIAADPFWRGAEKNACRYCDYASACHFEEGRGNDRHRWLPTVDAATFWRRIEEKGEDGDGVSTD